MTNTNTVNNNNITTTNTINIALAMPGNRRSLLVLATIENIDLNTIKTRYDSVDDNLAKIRSEIFQSIFEINNEVIGIEDIKTTNALALVFKNNLRLVIGNFSYYDIKMNYRDFLEYTKCACAIEEIIFDAKDIENLVEEVTYIVCEANSKINKIKELEER